MPTIKDMLTQPISLPRSIEASLPVGVPKLSNVLSQVTNALPDMPAVPNLPKVSGVSGFQVPKGVPDIVKGIEDNLPAGAPRMESKLNMGYRPIEIPLEKEISKGSGPVMSSGYRSI